MQKYILAFNALLSFSAITHSMHTDGLNYMSDEWHIDADDYNELKNAIGATQGVAWQEKFNAAYPTPTPEAVEKLAEYIVFDSHWMKNPPGGTAYIHGKKYPLSGDIAIIFHSLYY